MKHIYVYKKVNAYNTQKRTKVQPRYLIWRNSGPDQTLLFSCAEPNSVWIDSGAILERRQIKRRTYSRS